MTHKNDKPYEFNGTPSFHELNDDGLVCSRCLQHRDMVKPRNPEMGDPGMLWTYDLGILRPELKCNRCGITVQELIERNKKEGEKLWEEMAPELDFLTTVN